MFGPLNTFKTMRSTLRTSKVQDKVAGTGGEGDQWLLPGARTGCQVANTYKHTQASSPGEC